MKELTLHKAVAQYLTAALPDNAWFTTFPLGGGGRLHGARIKAMGTRRGTPDVLVVIDGKAIFLELKSDKGSVSPAQRETIAALRRAGAAVFVCRSLADVHLNLAGWIPLKARPA